MFEALLNDVMSIFRSTFLGGDLVSLAIAAGSVLVAALAMERGSQVGSMTLLALTLFALGGMVRGFFNGPNPETVAGVSDRAANQFESSWLQFADLQAGTLLAYFIAFMLLILVVFAVKGTINRG